MGAPRIGTGTCDKGQPGRLPIVLETLPDTG
jgi:hypothetical protein